MKVLKRNILAALLVSTALIGMGSASAVSAAEGEIRYGLNTSHPGFEPHRNSGIVQRTVNAGIYETLIGFDQAGQFVPLLAEEWSTEDGTTYTFKLRDGVTFHDGTPFTAADVKYTIERIQNPETGATLIANLNGITVEIVDDHTVKLNSPNPNASLLATLALPEAAIMSEQWMKTTHNLKTEANGTGPFTLVSTEPDVSISFAANSSYWEAGLPKLAAIEFSIVTNGDARVNAVRTGDLDAAELVPWSQIDALKATPGIDLEIASGGFMNVWYNTNRAPFDDARVRRAIGFAIDRDAMAKAACFSYCAPIYGVPVAADSPYFNEGTSKEFSYDPEKAKALLAEAGHADGFDMPLLCLQGFDLYLAICQVLQANLKDVGINVQIEMVDFPRFMDARNKADYTTLINGLSAKSSDPDAYAFYFSKDSTYWGKQQNYNNQIIETALAEGRATIDPAARNEIYARAEREILNDSPWTFIMFRDQAQAMRDDVTGFVALGGALSDMAGGIALKHLERK